MSTNKLNRIVRRKANRLRDIAVVLEKLEENKYVERLQKLYEEIFFNQQQFAVTELKRIKKEMIAVNQPLDLQQQIQENTQLFKQNFEVINSILLNEVWESVCGNLQVSAHSTDGDESGRLTRSNVSVEAMQSLNPEDADQADIHQHNNNNHHLQQQQQQQQQLLRAQQEQNGQNVEIESPKTLNHSQSDPRSLPRNSLAKSGLLAQNTSTYSMNSSFVSQNDTWVRTSLKQRNSSRSQEHQQQQQQQSHQNMHSTPKNDTSTLKRLNSMNTSNSMLNSRSNQSILDIKKQSDKKMSNTNLSMMSSSSLSTSKLGITSPFSELQESKNPLQTSFSRASRHLEEKEMSQQPGPSDYRSDKADKLVRKQSPKASFGNQKRTNFVDEKQRIESCSSTPGPQYNITQSKIYKPFKK